MSNNTSKRAATRVSVVGKTLAFLLSFLMIFSYAGMFAGLTADALNTEGWTVNIAVPETVYMEPQTNYGTTTTSVQKYVNNVLNSSGTLSLDKTAGATAGKFYIYSPQISSVTSITCDNANLSGLSVSKSGSLFSDTEFTMSLKSGISSTQTKTIKWTITCKMTDDSTVSFYAFTVAYAPNITPIFAAGRCKNTRGNNSFGSGMAWVAGIHGISSGASYWAKDNFLPLTGGPSQGGGETSPDSWFTNSSQCGMPTAGGYYHSKEHGYNHGDETLASFERSAESYIYVDTSRYSNTNQIPNLVCGVYVTDCEGATGTVWCYVGKLTNWSDRIQSGRDWYTRSTTNPSEYTASVTYFAGDCWTNRGKNAWHKNVAMNMGVPSGWTAIRGGLGTHDGGDRCFCILDVYVNFIQTNKATLRANVQECYGRHFQRNYTTDSWNSYMTALSNAAAVLGNPAATASQISDANTNLNTARGNLTTGVYMDGNGGTASTSFYSWKVGSAVLNKVSFPTGSYTASKSGFEFLGWNTDKDATTGTKSGNMSVDPMSTVYAIHKADLTYTFKYYDSSGTLQTETGSGTIYNRTNSWTHNGAPTLVNTVYNEIPFAKVGWSSSTGSTSTVASSTYNTVTPPTNNPTYYAVYKRDVKTEFRYYTASGTRATNLASTTKTVNLITGGTNTVADGGTITFDAPTSGLVDVTVGGVTYPKVGWALDQSVVSNENLITNLTSPVTVSIKDDHIYNAIYRKNITVSYDLNRGGPSIPSDPYYQYIGSDAANLLNSAKSQPVATANPSGIEVSRTGADSFIGWMVKNSATDPDPELEPTSGYYTNGQTFNVTGDTVLIAMFKDSRHTLKARNFDGVGTIKDASGTVIADQQIRYNYDGSIPVMDKTGADHYDASAHYVFIGFLVDTGNDLLSTAAGGYTVKNVTVDTTLIAQFKSYPHTWRVDGVVQEATCGQPGIVNRHCTVCGLTQNNYETEKLGHQTQLFDVKAATCTTDGSQGREVCMVCYKVKCYACEANGVDDPFVTLVTATVNGVKKKVCPVCGGVYDEVINPAVPAYGEFNEQGKRVHVFDYDGEYELDDAGNKVYKCLHCDRTVTVYASSGLVKVPEVPATCTETGCQAYYTDNNGHYYTDSNGYNDVELEDLVIPTLSESGQHTWEAVAAAAEENVEPTCTEPGYTQGTCKCSVCGAYDQDLRPAGHLMSGLVAKVEPTCTATGNIAYYYCSRCDQYYEDVNGVKRISNSFTKDHKAYCADCEAIVSVTEDEDHNWFCAVDDTHTDLMNTYVFLDKIDHKSAADFVAQTIMPTCLKQGGRYFGACTVCGQDIWTNVTEALGHSLQWVNGVDATCTATGKEGYYKCVNGCGSWYRDIREGEEEDDIETLPNAIEGKKLITEQAVTDMIPHTLEAVDANPASCTETGNIAYWKCTVCGAFFADENGETEIEDKDSVILGKTEHEYAEEPIETFEGTCTENSYNVYKCKNCTKTNKVTGDKLPHHYVTDEKAATCVEAGYTREKCTGCGRTRNQTTIPATGNHTPGEWVEDGSVRRTNCTVCGAEMVEPLNQEPTQPEQPATPSGERCPKCGFVHEGRTGIFVEDGLYCKVVGFFRKIVKGFK